MSEFVASLFAATGKPYRSVTSHPAMIHHRARSPRWRMKRSPSRVRPRHQKNIPMAAWDQMLSSRRVTASFEYVGEAREDIAAKFGIRVGPPRGIALHRKQTAVAIEGTASLLSLAGKHELGQTQSSAEADNSWPEPQLDAKVD
jgi:hypothetical protein